MATHFTRTLNALAADSGRPAWRAWAVSLLLAAAWMAWFVFGRLTLYEVSQQARVETQAAAHPVAALQGGALAATHLALGRRVRAGDVLLELDSRGAALRLREESQRLAALPARRAALTAEIAALQAARGHDLRAAESAQRSAQARAGEVASQLVFSREYERRLADEVRAGGMAEIDLLRARAEAERQQAQHAALQADSSRLADEARVRDGQARQRSESLQGQLATLDAEAQVLSATVARLETEIERLRVRAPVDGVVADVAALHPGAWVAEGQHVATVVPGGTLVLVADFAPAHALGRIHAGQAARVRFDGFNWAEHGSLAARVREVAGEPRAGRLRVELDIDRAGPAGGLPLQHGLSGTVEVALEDVSPAMLLLRQIGQRLGAAAATPGNVVPTAAAGTTMAVSPQ